MGAYFLGVHFPLDMLGAALISALSLCVAKVVWQRLGQTLVALCEALSRRLFSAAGALYAVVTSFVRARPVDTACCARRLTPAPLYSHCR